jgi:hypothetical protein
LRLIEDVPSAPDPHARAEPSTPRSPLQAFHWSLLAGFAAAQAAYLLGLVRFARWVVRSLSGA